MCAGGEPDRRRVQLGVLPELVFLARSSPADFVYLRLHGDTELYASGYNAEALRQWAGKIRGWLDDGQDVYAYFDNDIKVKAPGDAMTLATMLDE